jgi:RNA polymerase sigma-70 factor (ECF subfamily)
MSHDDRSTMIQGWIDRLLAGDESAREPLLDCASRRLARLARKMLRGFPGVGRWEQTDDVVQRVLLRLAHALRSVVPPTPRDFFRLSAAIIRRELIGLARHYQGPLGLGAHHSSRAALPDGGGGRGLDPSDPSGDPARLESWGEFHRQVEALPDDQREAFDLLWYQGLSQAEAALILGVSERTVKRRWADARLRLFDALEGQLPS